MPIQKRGGIESSPENSSRTRNGSKYLSSNLQAQAAIEPDPKISKNEARKHHKAGRQGRRLTCRCCGGRRRRRPRAAAGPGTCAPPAGASPLPVCHRARAPIPPAAAAPSRPPTSSAPPTAGRRPVLSTLWPSTTDDDGFAVAFAASSYIGDQQQRRANPARFRYAPRSKATARLAGFLGRALLLLSVRENNTKTKQKQKTKRRGRIASGVSAPQVFLALDGFAACHADATPTQARSV